MATKTRLLFRGHARALISHTNRILGRIQAYDKKQAANQAATGNPGNPIQISPQVKAAVSLLIGVFTAELDARG